MTKLDNDKLLRDFFTENKQEIADNGFSLHVMRHLPNQSNRLAHIGTAFVMTLGIVLFIWLGGLQAIWGTLREVFFSMLQCQETNLDPKSLIIATVVLLFFGMKKVVSMA